MKFGFCTVVGRPNVGKSTLVNALCGTKVAIVSQVAQTTRTALRGVVNTDDGQLVLVDTPGIHKPVTLLGERLNDVARRSLAEVGNLSSASVLCLLDEHRREQTDEGAHGLLMAMGPAFCAELVLLGW